MSYNNHYEKHKVSLEQANYKEFELLVNAVANGSILNSLKQESFVRMVDDLSKLHQETSQQFCKNLLSNNREMISQKYHYNYFKSSRQNPDEIAFSSYVKVINGRATLAKLPVRTSKKSKALYLSPKGKLVNKKPGKDTHSLDFTDRSNGKDILIFKKQQNNTGHSQDLSRDEIEKELRKAKLNKDNNKVFVAILDGDYWANEMPNLKSKYETVNVKIFNTDEYIREVCNL